MRKRLPGNAFRSLCYSFLFFPKLRSDTNTCAQVHRCILSGFSGFLYVFGDVELREHSIPKRAHEVCRPFLWKHEGFCRRDVYLDAIGLRFGRHHDLVDAGRANNPEGNVRMNEPAGTPL